MNDLLVLTLVCLCLLSASHVVLHEALATRRSGGPGVVGLDREPPSVAVETIPRVKQNLKKLRPTWQAIPETAPRWRADMGPGYG
jgi:hypothetical protein